MEKFGVNTMKESCFLMLYISCLLLGTPTHTGHH